MANTVSNTKSGTSKVEESDVEDEQRTPKEVINRYTIDLIAQHMDFEEELVLHWGVGRKNPCDWSRPEDSHLPRNSVRWSDKIAVQSVFERNSFYPEYRTLQLVFQWIEETEAPIQAINFVILEKKKNWWHNNGGKNFSVPCALVQGVPTQVLPVGE